MLESYDERKAAMVVTIAWGIWCNRNEIRNGGRQKSGKEIVQWTKQYLEEFYATTDRHDTPGTTSVAHVAVWTPPSTQRYKVNVNGAVFKS